MSTTTTQKQHQITKNLANDYISWRLSRAGHGNLNLVNKSNLKKNNDSKLCLIMRQMAYEFERRYNSEYQALGGVLSLNRKNCRDVFTGIVLELFEINLEDEKTLNCNWGRITGLFAFSGCLAVRCFEKGMSNVIYDIIDWVTQFLCDDLRTQSWMDSQNYWNGFMEYFNEKQKEDFVYFESRALNDEKDSISFKSVFCTVSQILGCSVGSIGVLTIGLIYIRK